jgi:hypothetical protein
MRSLPSFFSNTAMGFSRENVSIGMPKIAEGMAVFVSLWDRCPEAETGRFAPVTYGECHTLPRSTTHGYPHPPCLLFLQDKTPDAHPIREHLLMSQAEEFLEGWAISERTL